MFREAVSTFGDATIYLFMAGISTLLFVIRLIMAMFGADSGGHDGDFDLSISGDMDVDDGGHHADSTGAFKLFSILSITAFFMGAGWMGLAARLDWNLGGPVSALLAVGFGFAMMLLASGLSYLMRRLDSHHPQNIASCVGDTAQVYLTIPPKGLGLGQVTIICQGARRIVSACSAGPGIAVFSSVKVVGVQGTDTLVVEPAV